MEHHISIQASLSQLSVLRETISSFIGDELDQTEKGRVILAIDEAVSNIIVHGYNSDENSSIDIEMKSGPSSFTFTISDIAGEYNPLESSAPDIDAYHETGQTGGLGVDIYRRLMEAKYERSSSGGNRLILIKEKRNENH